MEMSAWHNFTFSHLTIELSFNVQKNTRLMNCLYLRNRLLKFTRGELVFGPRVHGSPPCCYVTIVVTAVVGSAGNTGHASQLEEGSV